MVPFDHIVLGGEPIIGEFNDLVPTFEEVEDEDENPLSKSLFNEDGNKLRGAVCSFGPEILVASNCLRTKKKAGSSISADPENEQTGDSEPESFEDGIGDSPVDPPNSSPKPVA